jgi:hypothetical protein
MGPLTGHTGRQPNGRGRASEYAEARAAVLTVID